MTVRIISEFWLSQETPTCLSAVPTVSTPNAGPTPAHHPQQPQQQQTPKTMGPKSMETRWVRHPRVSVLRLKNIGCIMSSLERDTALTTPSTIPLQFLQVWNHSTVLVDRPFTPCSNMFSWTRKCVKEKLVLIPSGVDYLSPLEVCLATQILVAFVVMLNRSIICHLAENWWS